MAKAKLCRRVLRLANEFFDARAWNHEAAYQKGRYSFVVSSGDVVPQVVAGGELGHVGVLRQSPARRVAGDARDDNIRQYVIAKRINVIHRSIRPRYNEARAVWAFRGGEIKVPLGEKGLGLALAYIAYLSAFARVGLGFSEHPADRPKKILCEALPSYRRLVFGVVSGHGAVVVRFGLRVFASASALIAVYALRGRLALSKQTALWAGELFPVWHTTIIQESAWL